MVIQNHVMLKVADDKKSHFLLFSCLIMFEKLQFERNITFVFKRAVYLYGQFLEPMFIAEHHLQIHVLFLLNDMLYVL